MTCLKAFVVALFLATSVSAQQTAPPVIDPFPPIPAEQGAIRVRLAEFASLPDTLGRPARMMHVVVEPVTRRLFANDKNGPLYTITYDGKHVAPYLDLSDPRWGVFLQPEGAERGFQNFVFHPDFARRGARGYGKFYTFADSSNVSPKPDFVSGVETTTHHTVLLEWTAKDPRATAYDGGPPRELIRIHKGFANHNGGHLGFNPTARRGQRDYGMLYVGVTDGGGSGDPLKLAQRLDMIYGKILRIDPLGSDSANGRYGIPSDNPFAGDGDPASLGEIYALGMRNPQRFAWDIKTGVMLVADIGQSFIEEISPVTRGANLGWSEWEGSYRFISRTSIRLDDSRSDPRFTYPLVEYDHRDPLLQQLAAVTGVIPYRASAIPQLKDKVVFGDITSGEVFAFAADPWPSGGSASIVRVVFQDGGRTTTLLELMKEKAAALGKPEPRRADLRMAPGPDGEIFLTNRGDGMIRVIRR